MCLSVCSWEDPWTGLWVQSPSVQGPTQTQICVMLTWKLLTVITNLFSKYPSLWHKHSLNLDADSIFSSCKALFLWMGWQGLARQWRLLHGCIMQGVKFLFFPIFSYFSQHTPIFPIFQQFPPIFPIFSHFMYNKQIFVRDLNILSLFKYAVYRVH